MTGPDRNSTPEPRETAREAALRRILDVISASRDDEAPVFKAILESARHLCNAPLAYISILDAAGTHVIIPVQTGARPEFAERLARFREPLDKDWLMVVRAMLSGEAVRIDDLADDDLYRQGNEYRVNMVDEEGMRSALAVPLVSDGKGIGSIFLYRREVAPFSDADMDLVETFAKQAVIAIENVRQFREVQARLAREKASADILGVISQSRDDEAPVFDAILENACKLCNAPLAYLSMATEDRRHVVSPARRGAFARFGETLDNLRVPLGESRLALARSISEGRVFREDDIADNELYTSGDPNRVSMVDDEGARSLLVVPMIQNGIGVGSITLYRREVSPFSDEDVRLVESFAAQAVIAIENVRQFREVQERLEREKASAEILEVISRSRDDEFPVFDTVLRSAARLCGAETSALLLGRRDEGTFRLAAYQSGDDVVPGAEYAARDPRRKPVMDLDPAQHLTAQTILTGAVMQVDDLKQHPLYLSGVPGVQAMVDTGLERTFLSVPLIDKDGPIGALNMQRCRVEAFRPDEITLIETFAAQAVIAIENVRQFREVQERLEREAASGEILTVISQSRDDEIPVFDTILKNALRLCAADMAVVNTANEARTEVGYAAGINSAGPQFQPGHKSWPIDSPQFVCRAILENQTFHTPDLKDTDLYRSGDVTRRNLVDNEGMRTQLVLPLVKGDQAIACFSLYRKKIQAFLDTEIALLETFAAQAVIAIENVRQFKALETLNAELGDRVQDQVGEIERMGRLKRFLPAAVADAVVSAGDEGMLSSHRALIAVLFADIRGFTAFCESAEPEETIEVLQTYHEEMGKLIAAHGAGVDHRSGDGIMVIFNDPLPCDDPAGDALKLAFAMRDRMAELCGKWRRLGHRLGFGTGLALGYATVGMVGAGGRFEYTASGTAVNLASRLCDQADDGDILLSPRAYAALEDRVQTQTLGDMEFKGLRASIEVVRAVAFTE